MWSTVFAKLSVLTSVAKLWGRGSACHLWSLLLFTSGRYRSGCKSESIFVNSIYWPRFTNLSQIRTALHLNYSYCRNRNGPKM